MKYKSENESESRISGIQSVLDCSTDNVTEEFVDDSMDNNEIEIDIKINSIMPLKDAKKMVERELITKVMNNVGSTYKAAKILEVSQATIARKSKRYNDEIFDLQESN